MNRKEYEAYLLEHLKPRRYKHCLGVEECAVDLARRWGADPEKASLAGLLHDCAKQMEEDVLLAYLREHGYEPDEWELLCPQTLHAPAGAIVAREVLGVEDEEVLHAIACHCAPGTEMNMLDKIISLSDIIEPNRKDIPDLDVLRTMAKKDLSAAYHRYLGNTIRHLVKKDIPVHPNTLLSYNQYFTDPLAKKRDN